MNEVPRIEAGLLWRSDEELQGKDTMIVSLNVEIGSIEEPTNARTHLGEFVRFLSIPGPLSNLFRGISLENFQDRVVLSHSSSNITSDGVLNIWERMVAKDPKVALPFLPRRRRNIVNSVEEACSGGTETLIEGRRILFFEPGEVIIHLDDLVSPPVELFWGKAPSEVLRLLEFCIEIGKEFLPVLR